MAGRKEDFNDPNTPEAIWYEVETTVHKQLSMIRFFITHHLGHDYQDQNLQVLIDYENPFDEAFSELMQIAKGLGSLRMDELDSYISNLSEIMKKKEIELFGIKIAGSILLYSGLIALLGTQCYFFLHYRNWLFKYNTTVTEAPWIGLYNDFLSRVTFTLSTQVLPIVSNLALIKLSISLDSNWIIISFIIIGVLVSGVMGYSTYFLHRNFLKSVG